MEMDLESCHAVWLEIILINLKREQKEETTIYCDKISNIALTTYHVFHRKSKQIDTRYHFI